MLSSIAQASNRSGSLQVTRTLQSAVVQPGSHNSARILSSQGFHTTSPDLASERKTRVYVRTTRLSFKSNGKFRWESESPRPRADAYALGLEYWNRPDRHPDTRPSANPPSDHLDETRVRMTAPMNGLLALMEIQGNALMSRSLHTAGNTFAKPPPTGAADNFDDGSSSAPASAPEQQYEDLDKYGPIRWSEPDGLRPLTTEETSKKYDDLAKYRPVEWREPDGLRALTAEEASKQYDDLANYGPVRWSEPDGLRPLTAEETSKEYDDLDAYSSPFLFNEPHGQPAPSREEESHIERQEDLHLYEPVMFNEPDGQVALSSEEQSLKKRGEDLHLYTPVMHNEPDGQPLPGAEEESLGKRREDLGTYHPVMYNEPDGQPAPSAEVLSKDYKDLGTYQPVMYHEPDGQPPLSSAEEQTKRYEDLGEYSPFRWHEPDGRPPAGRAPEAVAQRYSDVAGHGPRSRSDADAQLPSNPRRQSKQCRDVDSYQFANDAFGSELQAVQQRCSPGSRPVGRVAQSVEETHQDTTPTMDAGTHTDKDVAVRVAPHGATLRYVEEETEQQRQPVEEAEGTPPFDASPRHPGEADPCSAAQYPESEDPKRQGHVNGDLESAPEATDGRDAAALAEDSNSKHPSTVGAGRDGGDENITTLDERYPKIEETSNCQTQPTATRPSEAHFPESELKMDSRIPAGLGTSYIEEYNGATATQPVFVPSSGALAASRQVGGTTTAAAAAERPGDLTFGENDRREQEFVYKVLTYDPSLATVGVSETTSMGPDHAQALTPGEALVRLAHPSKFVSHLGPLQAQGFEIVSGGPDILVFRKMRAASAAGSNSGAIAASTMGMGSPVNPIDMTGSHPLISRAARFASPTGFVTYDLPGDFTATKPPPPPPQPKIQEAVKRKGGVVRRAVTGAVWAAGLTYSASVVAEYFRTGGMDGKGPRTF